jgi:Neocarzinostatin family
VTDLFAAPEPGSTKKIPVAAAPRLDRKATVTPSRGLEGGQLVTVRWEGFSTAGGINVVQCNPDRSQGSAGCDLTKGKILQPDPTGEGELQLEVVEGPVGNGICDADHPPCVILVNDDSSQLPEANLQLKIRFAQ